jgi:hypothetical protein
MNAVQFCNTYKYNEYKNKSHHLQNILGTKTKVALKYCSPSKYINKKGSLKLPNTCKVLWDEIEEITESISKLEEKINTERKLKLESQYWYYEEDDITDLFYDV